MINKRNDSQKLELQEEKRKRYKKEMSKCLKKVLGTLTIYSLIVTSPMPKGGLSIIKRQKIRAEVENNDIDKLRTMVMEYTPEKLQNELTTFWTYNIDGLKTEEIYSILKNARYYSQGKMENKEVYEMALNYLGYGLERKKATLSLYLIQNFIKVDNILKLALLEPEKLSLELTEKYGESFFLKLQIWVDSINKHSKQIDIFADENNLYDVYPANDIEKVLLKPYSYEEYSSFFNEEEDVHYEYYCRLDDRKQNEYLISVYDKYFSGQSFVIPDVENPYESVEEKIKEDGKNKIIAMLQKRHVFDGSFNIKDENNDYRNYDTLTLDLLSMLDSEAVTFKENETYEEYFAKLEKSFPTLDVYRFNSLLIDMDGKYNYDIYKLFMPLYLEKLSKKEKITEDDIIKYTEIYTIFYRESRWQIYDEFEKVVSCYLNPLKANFDNELRNILRAKNEEDLITKIDNISNYKLKLVQKNYGKKREGYEIR